MAAILNNENFFVRVDEITYMRRTGKTLYYYLRGNNSAFSVSFDTEGKAADIFEKAMREVLDL